MYAIIKTGSKQFRVKKGDVIDVELLNDGKEKIEFKEVLLFNDGEKTIVGSPNVPKVTVTGKLLGEVKGPKVIAFKFKKRKNYRRKVGHRQRYNRVEITTISAGEKKAAAPKKAAASKES